MRVVVVLLCLSSIAQAQQLPLTGWRAQIDIDLSKLACPRDAHLQIFNILQEAERQSRAAQVTKPDEGK
jgi:hypothetical protein